MDYVQYILLALVLFLILKQFFPVKGIRNISTTEIKSLLKEKDTQFVDVRTVGEYKANHIKEFKNIPLNVLANRANQELSKDNEVIVICQSGMRSQKASKLLKKLGFTKVTNVKGGMSAWF